MRRVIRFFMLGEGASFIGAGLIHFGVLMRGYEHQQAGTGETVIGSILLIGLDPIALPTARESQMMER